MQTTAHVNDFNAVVALFGQHREAILQSQIMNFVHLVKFEQGRISVRLKENAPSIPAENITCMTRLDHNRALGQV